MKVDGAKIKAARVAAELAVKQVALAADLTPRRIRQIEKDGGEINSNIAESIASCTGVKLEDLAG